MPLIHGQDIAAGEVEREVSGWDAVRFARLCNALAWAVAWPDTQTVPAFTERVNVADNGIDAEWSGEYQPARANAFLRRGKNIFQYKKREVSEQSRRTIAAALGRELNGTVANIECDTGSALSSYVFFTNVDLTTEQQDAIRTAILVGADEGQTQASVVSAAQLAAMLNQLPHVRSAFFATAAFRTWGASWDAHRRVSAFAQTDLVGREEALATVQSWVDEPEVQIIGLSATHMMGKSRLAIEATRHRDVAFVEALGRQSVDIDSLLRLASRNQHVIVLINDPEVRAAEELAREVLANERLKVIFCVSTADASPALNFGLDERVRQLALSPLTEDKAKELLQAGGGRFDFALESWIVENAGGVPGILLAAGHVGDGLRANGDAFLNQISTAFEREVERRCPREQAQALSALAMMSHVGVTGETASEAATISECFGIDLNSILNAIEPLSAAGFLRLDGSYVEVVPRPLANRLAARLVRGRLADLGSCLNGLSVAGRHRLLRRLVTLPADEGRQFWSDVLGVEGPFGSIAGLAQNSELFEFAAAASGPRACGVLRALLSPSSVEDRLTVAGSARRNVIHAVEEMLFRVETSEGALRCLALLAEAENETWGNNATGIFREVFHPLHTQMPLPLVRRLEVLRDLLRVGGTERQAALAVNAGAQVSERASHMLRQSIAAAPLDRIPEMTWGDVWEYQISCLELVNEASQDARPRVAQGAARGLPRAAAILVSQGQAERAMPVLQTMVDRAVAGDELFALAELAGDISWCRHALRDEAHGGEAANAGIIGDLTTLFDRLRNSPFAMRLRLWVGGWFLDLDDQNAPAEMAEREIRTLAENAVALPQLVTEDEVTWMLGDEAKQSGRFWFELGRADVEGRFEPMARGLGERRAGIVAFVNYVLGLNGRDSSAAAVFFRLAAESPATQSRAVVLGALDIETREDGAARIAGLLREGRLDPRATLNDITHSRWVMEVDEDRLVEILEYIVGASPEASARIPELVGFRHHTTPLQPGPLSEFAWRCLEARPPNVGTHEAWNADRLAARLSAFNPDRGFNLFQRCISDDSQEQRWNPIVAGWSDPQFWPTLLRLDRTRALRTVLDVALAGGVAGLSATWHLPALINIVTDGDDLLAYATRGEAAALAVCSAITGGRAGFWPIAFGLIDAHPGSARLRRELESRVEQMGQVIRGPMSEHYRICLDDVEQARLLPDVSSAVRSWLEDFSRRLDQARVEQARREADERVNRE